MWFSDEKTEEEMRLEEEFREVFDKHHDELQNRVELIAGLVEEIRQLSEETGIPVNFNDETERLRFFFGDFEPWSTVYVPDSYKEKWGALNDKRNSMYLLTRGKVRYRIPGPNDNWIPSQEC